LDDDAAMTVLLAESLAEKGDFDANDVAERWVKWMQRDGRGIGLTTQRALRLIESGTEPFEAGRLAHNARAASNGAVMRCIPVALRYHDNVDKMVRVSTQQAAITHADQRCTWGAAAVNLAARELLHGNQHFVEEVLHRLQGGAPARWSRPSGACPGAGRRPADQCGWGRRLRGPLRGNRLLVRDAPPLPRGSTHLFGRGRWRHRH